GVVRLCACPVFEGRQSPQPPGEADAFLDSPLGALLRLRHVEAGRAQRGAKRAKRLPVQGLGGHGASPPYEVRARGGPPQLHTEGLELLKELRAGREPARDEASLPLRAVPAPEAHYECLWMRPSTGVPGELPHRGRAPEALRGRSQLREQHLIGVARRAGPSRAAQKKGQEKTGGRST